MKIFNYKWFYLLGIVGLILLTSCQNSLTLWEEDLPSDEGKPVRVSLMLKASAKTDDLPTNSGLEIEREIRNLTVFLFQSEGSGINMDGDPNMNAVLYYESNEWTEQADGSLCTAPRWVESLHLGRYDLLVVANAGNQWVNGLQVTTLGDLREKIEQHAWQEEKNEQGEVLYHSFVMSSANVGDFLEITPENYAQNFPATNKTPIELQRIAARVDYYIEPLYETEDRKGQVQIVGATLVNAYRSGSYLFKRLASTADATASFSYLVPEQKHNYVVDPKLTADKQDIDYQFPFLLFSTDWDFPLGVPLQKESKKTKQGYRIGYTLENTNQWESSSGPSIKELEQYATGVVFKAVFQPEGFQDIRTFFVVNGKVYKTMREAMDEFEGFAGWEKSCPDLSASVEDWRKYALSLKSNDPTGYKYYLIHEVNHATNQFKPWADYMLDVCGYKEDNQGKVEIASKTQPELARHGTQTYQDGICYYTYWIQHIGTPNIGMQYAIVRNNLYELSVRSIKGLGDDVPGETSLSVSVAVKDWTVLDEENVIL
ncbi:MAG: Mfa1 family fimbria major subunit [Parabacteroides sp.]|nr:Mfa1 family fimbria major subunit [Parabacteroides sp.]